MLYTSVKVAPARMWAADQTQSLPPSVAPPSLFALAAKDLDERPPDLGQHVLCDDACDGHDVSGRIAG